MSREWKPGDVLVVRGEVALVTTNSPASDAYLYVETARGRCLNMDEIPSDAHPLAVIDPEDREQVGRLLNIIRPGAMGGLDQMQAALREFANPTPPKPDEPTGLGAVVEDAEGDRWLAVGRGGAYEGPFRWARDGRVAGHWSEYADIDAVRVLSEGVTS